MNAMGIVYSNTAATEGFYAIQRHTKCIHFINLHNSTNATVRLNGGPHEIVIPAGKNYVEVEGDYTSFNILTAGVTLGVFAIG